MRPRLKVLYSLLVVALPIIGMAQQEFSQLYVEGYVFDAERKEPIPFVTIKVKGWAKGVVTNRNGSFKVPKKFAELNDTLVISSIGYKTEISMLRQMMANESNIIFLQPQAYGLEEIVVSAKKKKKLRAKAIVRKAIRAIPENFSIEPFALTGYYRDYQWHKDNYLNLNEAILSIYDQGFESTDKQSTAFALHQIILNDNFPRDSISHRPYDYVNKSKIIDKVSLNAYGGNELKILRVHDAIRNYDVSSYSYVYRLKNDFLKYHKFKVEKDVFLNDLAFYNITFTKSHNGYSVSGHLLIDKENFSIYKFYYSLFSKHADTKSAKNVDDSKKDLIFEVLSEYRPFKDQMFLHYITFNNNFILPESPRFYAKELVVDLVFRRLSLEFNNPVNQKKANIVSNYKLEFFGEYLPIKEVMVDPSSPNSVLIYPLFKNQIKESHFYNYLAHYKANKVERKRLHYSVENITDTDGNLVNVVYDYKQYQQFREFFTQEVTVQQDAAIPESALLMNMNTPVFGRQPLQKKDDLESYWMNTPLNVIDN